MTAGNGLRVAVATVMLSALSGCSFLGLSDGLDSQAACSASADCADLNSIMPSGDECLTWQCSPTQEVCVLLTRDDDGDGAIPALCQPVTEPDCDDTNASVAPGLAELCDGADNDCDDVVDEGALAGVVVSDAPLSSVPESFDGAYVGDPPAGQFVYSEFDISARAPVGSAAVTDAQGNGGPLGFIAPNGTPMGALAFQGVATAAVGDQQMVVAGQPQGMIVGLLEAESMKVERATKLKDDATALIAVAGDDSCLGELSCPALVAHVEVVLEHGDVCGQLAQDASPVDLLVVDSEDPTQIRAGATLAFETRDPSAPAVLSLGPDRWLVAYASVGGVRVVDVVLNESQTLEMVEHVVIDASEPGQLFLTRGPGTQVALAMRVNCGVSDLDVTLLDVGDVGVSSIDATVQLPRSASRRARYPAVLWLGPPTDYYLALWQERSFEEVFGQLFDASGNKIGARVEVPVSPLDTAYGSYMGLRSDGQGGASLETPLVPFGSDSSFMRTIAFECTAN